MTTYNQNSVILNYMDISIVNAIHPSLQCSLENSNVYEMLLQPVFLFFFAIKSLKLKRNSLFLATHETNFPDEKEEDLFIDIPENNGVADNEGDSYSASTKRPLPKKFKKSKEDETMNEALQVIPKRNNQKQEDSFDIFGRDIANEIRSLDNTNPQR